jgi:hypothetical protein
MKKTLATIGLAITTLALSMGIAEAKSVKWSCVALDPANPSTYTCYGSTRRP